MKSWVQELKRFLVLLGSAVLIVYVLAFTIVTFFYPGGRARPQGQLTACKSTLKNIGTALEMYATDNDGRFPLQLQKITPNYLKTLPTCPGSGTDTYSSGYVSLAPAGDSKTPDQYTVVCSSNNHKDAGASLNYPQYTSSQGLIER